MTRVLITGASGFIGTGLCAHLLARDLQVRCAVRTTPEQGRGLSDDVVIVGDVAANPAWDRALEAVDVVVHLAARVHRMGENDAGALRRFREVNVDASAALARRAVAMGVRRLVFLSTIKVNGEETSGMAFTARDPTAPSDPYAVSKWEAEEALGRVARESGLELVILRPPLVYGPGVGGNFRRLLGLVWRGLPLPFGAIHNHRSMLGLGNLCELVSVCLEHPAAPGEVLLAADSESLSTPDLIRCMAAAMHRPARLLRVPPRWLELAGVMTGRAEEVARLCRSLVVDITATERLLGWTPTLSIATGVEEAAAWFLTATGKGRD